LKFGVGFYGYLKDNEQNAKRRGEGIPEDIRSR
jgi:hypothetical protein